jgi:hypothetical protein
VFVDSRKLVFTGHLDDFMGKIFSQGERLVLFLFCQLAAVDAILRLLIGGVKGKSLFTVD